MMKGQAIYNEVLSGNEMGLPQRNNYFKCVELTCSGHDMIAHDASVTTAAAKSVWRAHFRGKQSVGVNRTIVIAHRF